MKELNAVYKRRYSYDIAVVCPSTYPVSVSTLSIHMLYFKLNSYREFYAQRVVYDKPSWRNGFSGIEVGTPLSKFDVLLFSVHYELDYVRLVRMLLLSGIEPLAKKRKGPLVVIGGPAPTANPWPLYEIADVIVLGEMEPVLEKLLWASNNEKLDELADVPGVFIPGFAEKRRRAWLKDLNLAWQPELHVMPPKGGVYGRAYLLEVSRGCRYMCRFCLLAHNFVPERSKALSVLKRQAEAGMKANRVNTAVLISSNYPGCDEGVELLRFMVEDLGMKVSIPSVRAETLNEELLTLMRKGGQRTLTLAPEAEEKIRMDLNKHTSDERYFEAMRFARKVGFDKVKLYFLYGIPGERLEKIVEFVKKAKKLGFREVYVSANPLIPKIGTPMSGFKMPTYKELVVKRRFLEKGPYRFDGYGPREALVQATVSTASKELGHLLIRWASLGTDMGSLRRALKEENIEDWDGLFMKYGSRSPWGVAQ